MSYPFLSVATHKYKPPPGSSDSLAFAKGEQVTVLASADDDGDWLRGKNEAGHEGIFPAQFVERVEQEKEDEPTTTQDEESAAVVERPVVKTEEAAPPTLPTEEVKSEPSESPDSSVPSQVDAPAPVADTPAPVVVPTPTREPSLPPPPVAAAPTPIVPSANTTSEAATPSPTDPPVAPKKPLSALQARIAALNAAGAGAAPPPAPRPKPAFKPKNIPPPAAALPSSSSSSSPPPVTASSAPAEPIERSGEKGGMMSAEDAKESIGKGGSLKDRIAALQGGLQSFEAPAAPGRAPVPWKRPSVPVIEPEPALEAVEGVSTEDAPRPLAPPAATLAESVTTTSPEEPISSPPSALAPLPLSETTSPSAAPSDLPSPTSEEEDPDPEATKRAALAARMAGLGGQRVGMSMPALPRKAGPPRRRAAAPPSPSVEDTPVPVVEKEKEIDPEEKPIETAAPASSRVERELALEKPLDQVIQDQVSKTAEEPQISQVESPVVEEPTHVVPALAAVGVATAGLATTEALLSEPSAPAAKFEEEEDDEFATPDLPDSDGEDQVEIPAPPSRAVVPEPEPVSPIEPRAAPIPSAEPQVSHADQEPEPEPSDEENEPERDDSPPPLPPSRPAAAIPPPREVEDEEESADEEEEIPEQDQDQDDGDDDEVEPDAPDAPVAAPPRPSSPPPPPVPSTARPSIPAAFVAPKAPVRSPIVIPRALEPEPESDDEPASPVTSAPPPQPIRKLSVPVPAAADPAGGENEGEEEEEEDPEVVRRRALAARMAKLGGMNMRMGPMMPPVGGPRKPKKQPSDDSPARSESTEDAPSSEPEAPRRMPGGIPTGGVAMFGIPPPRMPSLPPSRSIPDPREEDEERVTAPIVERQDQEREASYESSHDQRFVAEPTNYAETNERSLDPQADPEQEDEEEDEEAPPPPPPRSARPTVSSALPPTALPPSSPPPIQRAPQTSPSKRMSIPVPVPAPSLDTTGVHGVSIDFDDGAAPTSPVLGLQPQQSRPSVTGNFKARDVDLEMGSHWWRSTPFGPPEGVASRKDVLLETAEGVATKRGATRHDNEIEIIYDDFSKTTITVSCAADDPTESSTVISQIHSPPPSAPSLALLSSFSSTLGSQVFAAAFSQSKQRGTTQPAFISFCLSRASSPLPPIGHTYGYPVLSLSLATTKGATIVTSELDEPRAGDVVVFDEAKFKHNLSTTKVGHGDGPHVAVVQAWDSKKRKLRALEVVKDGAVEEGAWRMEDLKGGKVVVYRVVERAWIEGQ
ncbi:hypothetical protein RQP46_002801 [Phenoliferia psychrophenolica]